MQLLSSSVRHSLAMAASSGSPLRSTGVSIRIRPRTPRSRARQRSSWLQKSLRRKLDVRRCNEYFPQVMGADIVIQQTSEVEDHTLMVQAGRRTHVQLPVQHLVPLSVVGKRSDHLSGPVGVLRGHAHSVRSARRWKQANIRRG